MQGVSCERGIKLGAGLDSSIIKQIKITDLKTQGNTASGTATLNGQPTATFQLNSDRLPQDDPGQQATQHRGLRLMALVGMLLRGVGMSRLTLRLGLVVVCGLVVAVGASTATVLPGEVACGKVTLRGDFAGRADVVVIRHRTDCATARRVAQRAASRPTAFGARTPAPAGWTCMASFRPSLGYVLRHAVTCQRGRDLSSIDRPAVAIALPDIEVAHCGDVRVNRFLRPDPRGAFGAFGIVARGVRCPAARGLAGRYVHTPSAPEHKTRLDGWICTPHPTAKAQQVRVSCTLRGATVTFEDELPSG